MTTTKRNAPTTTPRTTPGTIPAANPQEKPDARALIAVHIENPSAYNGRIYASYTKGSGHPGAGCANVEIEPYDTLEERLDAAVHEKTPRGGLFVVRLRLTTQLWAPLVAWHEVPPREDDEEETPRAPAAPDPLAEQVSRITAQLEALTRAQAPQQPPPPSWYEPRTDHAQKMIDHVTAENTRLLRDLDDARKKSAESYGEGYKKGFDDGHAQGKKNATQSAWDDPKAVSDLVRELRPVLGRSGKKGDKGDEKKKEGGGGQLVDLLALAMKNEWAPAVAIEAVRTMRGAKTIATIATHIDALIDAAKEHDALKDWATSDKGSAWFEELKEELEDEREAA